MLNRANCIFFAEIYRASPERRRECLYYLALGHYKINNFVDARLFVRQLLKLEPDNVQAVALNKLIDEKVSRGTARRGKGNDKDRILIFTETKLGFYFLNRGCYRYSYSEFSFRRRRTFDCCNHIEKKIKVKEVQKSNGEKGHEREIRVAALSERKFSVLSPSLQLFF